MTGPGSAPDADVAFWVRTVARLGGPVLELGAGDGRVAVPLARAGAQVWALDRDAVALGRLVAARDALGAEAGARLHVVEGDVRTFALPDRFGAVVWPRDGLGLLLDDLERREALARAAAHLRPGGALVVSVAHGPLVAADTLEVVTGTATIRDADPRGMGLPVAVHLFGAPELRALLGWAGLRLVRLSGGYDGRPLDARSPRLIAEAVRG